MRKVAEAAVSSVITSLPEYATKLILAGSGN